MEQKLVTRSLEQPALGELQPASAVNPDSSSNSPRPPTCRKGKSNTKDAEDKKKLLLTVAAGVAAITAIVLGVKKAREVSLALKEQHVVHPGSKVPRCEAPCELQLE